jgi:hypothetical protein
MLKDRLRQAERVAPALAPMVQRILAALDHRGQYYSAGRTPFPDHPQLER